MNFLKGLLIPYQEKVSYIKLYTKNFFFATFLYTSTIEKEVFDVEIGEVKTENQVFLYKISFQLEFGTGLLFSYSGGYRLARLTSKIIYICGKDSIVKDVFINLRLLLNEILRNNLSCNRIGLSINRFKPHPKLIGNFFASTDSIELAQKIFDEYSDDISEMSVHITSEENENFALQVSSNGKVSLRAEEDSWDELFEAVKDMISRSRNA